MERYPGEVYQLPPDDLDGGDNKSRPHVLLTLCNDESEVATLAFCSSSHTEASYGAKYVLVDPASTMYKGSGLTKATYVYPSRLVLCDAEIVREQQLRGRLIDEMPEVRLKLVHALGIGTGSACGEGEAARSLRGRIVRLRREAWRAIDTTFALVVSDPAYSSEQRYLNIIPLFNATEYEPMAETDLIVHEAGFDDDLGWPTALLPVSWVQNVFMPKAVESFATCELDDRGMRQVDQALRLHFGL